MAKGRLENVVVEWVSGVTFDSQIQGSYTADILRFNLVRDRYKT